MHTYNFLLLLLFLAVFYMYLDILIIRRLTTNFLVMYLNINPHSSSFFIKTTSAYMRSINLKYAKSLVYP